MTLGNEKRRLTLDIFSEIEGLSGENLGSALFRYLIFNSQEIRDSIISLLSDKSPVGPIEYSSHFACQTEYPTTHSQYGSGRLDILIQLDDVVVGIENKFFSKFTENQPLKYLETLKMVGASLSKINHSKVRNILYVFCPASRKKEAISKIEGLENSGVISWEEVLAACKNTNNISNPITKAVQSEFIKYLERHFSFIHDFERKAIHLRKSFPEYGSPLQYELAAKLWSYLPSSGARLSNGKTWIGYYFFNDPAIQQKGWFGFVPVKEIKDKTKNNTELIIASTYKPELSDDFHEVRLKNDNFIGAPANTNSWVINFNHNWNSVEIWREKLSPFWGAIQNDIT